VHDLSFTCCTNDFGEAGNFATSYDASPLSLLFLPSWLLSHLAAIHCKGNTLFKGEYTLAIVMSTKKDIFDN